MTQNLVAGTIGGTFGLVFVLVNAGPPLASTLADLLRVGAALAFVAMAVMLVALRRRAGDGRAPSQHAASDRQLFRRRYWLIVGIEAALLLAGRAVIVGLHAPQQSFVAWIAFVVGVHFLAFAAFGVWDAGVRVTGWILAGLGLIGLALSATPAAPWVPTISGVLSGVALLGGTLSWIARDLARAASAGSAGARSDAFEGR